MPQVSVVVVNWNGRQLLEDCLGSLANQTFKDFETILVDNGSKDDSVNWVKENYPGVKLIPLNENVGFSAGNNIGYQHSRGEFIALLNNDTKVRPEWLEALYNRIKTDEKIAACDSLILYYDRPDSIWTAGGCYSIAGAVSPRLNSRPHNEAGCMPVEVFVAVACAAIYRRSVINEIGFFDEDYFNGYEDVDWSFRAHLFGYKISNEPTAIVHHKVSSSQVHNSPDFVYNGQRNVSATFIKNMPRRLLTKYLPLHLAYMAGSFLYFAKIGRAGDYLRAKWDLLCHLHDLWAKRRDIQNRRKISEAELEDILERKWIWNKMGKYLNKDYKKG
jgi:GT2 family glycosyltransferase